MPVKRRHPRRLAFGAVLAVATGAHCAAPRNTDPADPAHSSPAIRVEPPPDAPPEGAAADGEIAFEDEASATGCEPDESEVCVCPDGTTGSRRCDGRGRAFSACDACPKPTACGARSCEMRRVEPVGLSLPGCCPPGRPDRCGIDVSFVAKNYGYRTACLELDAPGVIDTSCPSTTLPIPEKGSVTFAGCRTPRGRCGYDVDIPDVIDLGCTEPPER